MSLVGKLIGFGLRQAIGAVAGDAAGQTAGEAADSVIQRVERHYTDHSQTLPKALARANDRAWQALSIALAGDTLLEQISRFFFASGDDKGIREQVRLFLLDKTIGYEEMPGDFRKKCLSELTQAKKAGLLTVQNPSQKDVAQQTANFQRYGDPKGMLDGAEQAVRQIADDLPAEYGNLAKLLRQPPAGGPPLLASAFAYFFSLEVQTDDELANALSFDGLRQLSASQAKAFGEVNKALTSLGDQFGQVFQQVIQQLERIETSIDGLRVDVHRLSDDVKMLLTMVGMLGSKVKPEHSRSIQNTEKIAAVKNLLTKFAQLPPDLQNQLPDLLSGLGKLQHGIGDFDGAKKSFLQAADSVSDKAAKALAHYNAYRVALDKKEWDEALKSIQEAASLDPQQFAPFPFQRYKPIRIIGAGGFRAAFLCHDRNFAKEVVVKAFHATDMERSMDSVFQEARILGELGHDAFIRVRDCEYADPTNQARPYLIMDFFQGVTLEIYIQERGVLTPEHLIEVAREIAIGMKYAHQKNILHRDLKPGNVLVRQAENKWEVKIIDFGLAMHRQAIEANTPNAFAGDTPLINSLEGTPRYAPPEQMDPSLKVPPGRYSDVYAFGKMCCYALFRTTRPTTRHWKTVPDLLRSGLQEMFEKCWEEEVEHRYPDFEPVLKVLEELNNTRKAEPGRTCDDSPKGKREHLEQDEAKRTKQEEQARVERREQEEKQPQQQELARLQQEQERKRREQEEAEKKRKEEQERQLWEQQEQARLQQEGETRLTEFLHEVFSRTQGKPTKEDEVAANDLRNRHLISSERTKTIVREFREQWQKAYPPAQEYVARAQDYLAKKEYDRAIAETTGAIRLDPKCVLAYTIRADAYVYMSEFDCAIADATEAICLDPKNALAYRIRSKASRMKNDYARAISDATKAIGLDPKYALAYGTRAEAYRMKGDFVRSIADATEAIRLDPKCVPAYTTRAEAYRNKNELNLAIADLTEALRLSPNNERQQELARLRQEQEQQRREQEEAERKRQEEQARAERRAQEAKERQQQELKDMNEALLKAMKLFGATFV